MSVEPKPINLFQKKPSSSVSLVIHCHAPRAMFARDMSPKVQAEVDQNGPITCGGSGYVCSSCEGCRFVRFETPEVI